jgi:hypothetical protein
MSEEITESVRFILTENGDTGYDPECDVDIIIDPDNGSALVSVQMDVSDRKYDAIEQHWLEDDSVTPSANAQKAILEAIGIEISQSLNGSF